VLNPYRDRYRDRLEVWDFPDCDTSEPVEITVILEDLSDEDRDHFEAYLEGRRDDGTFGGWDSTPGLSPGARPSARPAGHGHRRAVFWQLERA